MEEDRTQIIQGLEFRSLTTEDIPSVVELEAKNFSAPWSAQSFQNVIEDDFSYSFVGVLNGQVIAYSVFGVIEDYSELWNIAVEERFRNMGIGDRLLNQVIDLCRSYGVSTIFLQVRESNIPAQNLYRKNGFTYVMVQKNYYHTPIENALVFRLDIDPPEPRRKRRGRKRG